VVWLPGRLLPRGLLHYLSQLKKSLVQLKSYFGSHYFPLCLNMLLLCHWSVKLRQQRITNKMYFFSIKQKKEMNLVRMSNKASGINLCGRAHVQTIWGSLVQLQSLKLCRNAVFNHEEVWNWLVTFTLWYTIRSIAPNFTDSWLKMATAKICKAMNLFTATENCPFELYCYYNMM